MIEELVDQIEGRFAELERQMSDPEVIADRERYAEVGREYRELEPAHELAREYAKLSDDLEGARELLAEDGDDPELRKLVADAPGRLERARRADPPGDGRARPERLQERPGRDPRRDGRRRGGAVRGRPVQDADSLRGAAWLRDRGPVPVPGRGRRLQGGDLRHQGRWRLFGVQVRGRNPPRAAGAEDRVAGADPHLDRDRGGAARGRGGRGRRSTRTTSRWTSTAPPAPAASR